jgi:hypothetical protein
VNGYAINGMGREAVHLFQSMPPALINESTHLCVLNACSHSGLVDTARSIFSTINKRSERIYTAMVGTIDTIALSERWPLAFRWIVSAVLVSLKKHNNVSQNSKPFTVRPHQCTVRIRRAIVELDATEDYFYSGTALRCSERQEQRTGTRDFQSYASIVSRQNNSIGIGIHSTGQYVFVDGRSDDGYCDQNKTDPIEYQEKSRPLLDYCQWHLLRNTRYFEQR